MTELVCELTVNLDGFARGQRSPAYYGYLGPYEMLEGLPAAGDRAPCVPADALA